MQNPHRNVFLALCAIQQLMERLASEFPEEKKFAEAELALRQNCADIAKKVADYNPQATPADTVTAAASVHLWSQSAFIAAHKVLSDTNIDAGRMADLWPADPEFRSKGVIAELRKLGPSNLWTLTALVNRLAQQRVKSLRKPQPGKPAL